MDGRSEVPLIGPDEAEEDHVPAIVARCKGARHLLPLGGEVKLGVDVVLLQCVAVAFRQLARATFACATPTSQAARRTRISTLCAPESMAVFMVLRCDSQHAVGPAAAQAQEGGASARSSATDLGGRQTKA